MEYSPEDLILRLANLEDHNGILNITRDEQLYDGMDYLPHALKNWLKEAEVEKSFRRNFVFLLAGEIVGFVSIYFQNEGKVVAKFAFRVCKGIRGKGYGKKITSLLEEYLKQHYPKLLSTLSVISDSNLREDEIKSSKHGDLLAVKSYYVYRIKAELFEYSSHTFVEPNLTKFSKDQFSNFLKGNKAKRLFKGSLVHMNFIPILIESEDDIEFATRKRQIVLVEDSSSEMLKSLSILTLPYPVPNGNHRVSIDIFTDEKNQESIKNHISYQLRNITNEIGDKSRANKGEYLLTIFTEPQFASIVFDIMDGYGLQKYYTADGSQNRRVNNMYIYQKRIF